MLNNSFSIESKLAELSSSSAKVINAKVIRLPKSVAILSLSFISLIDFISKDFKGVLIFKMDYLN